ncbi:FtsX-like permease family protein [Microbispora sp. NPDC049125]|uniref:FtsX-like permease family protein n=1 Tax=Microbispora sp. NPDC049125 TaxID=3154929 RepID=UPI003467540F
MLRGLWRRRWLSLVVLIVAVVPVAAASLAPVYTGAARTAIIRNALDGAVPDHRGWRVTSPAEDAGELARQVAAPFLRPPIAGAELLSPEIKGLKFYSLLWQDGQCGHVTLLKGRCPSAAGEIMVSRASGFLPGATVKLSAFLEGPPDKLRPVPLRVVGVYRVDPADPFWFGRALFPQTAGVTEGNGDPLITTPQTQARYGPPPGDQIAVASGKAWVTSAIVYVDARRVTSQDLAALEAVQGRLRDLGQLHENTTVFTYMETTLQAIRLQIDSLSVPTTLVALQLVVLGWLLLFLTVRDLVAARAPEIALARLRGLSSPRIWAFGLSEPAAILLAALPLGVAAGWSVATAMAGRLLRADLPVTVDADAVAYGVAAVAGGLLAAAAAARQTVAQPVVEQWRRTPRGRGRTWIPEAVILTITVAGLVELLAGGAITDSTGQRAGALVAPGLLAVAVALLARRLLPLACAALFRLTRTRGGIGAFLAVRQISRGPATASTVIVLAAGLGLAVFAVAAWSVTSRNFTDVARVHNGAETVFVVPPGDIARLRELSDGIPGTAPVVVVPGPPAMLATDLERFASVALWRPEYGGGRPLAELVRGLTVPVAPRVTLTGDRIRAHLAVPPIPKGYDVVLYADFRVAGQTTPASIPLARPIPSRAVYEWGLPRGCQDARCELRGLRVEVKTTGSTDYDTPPDSITVTSLEARHEGRWTTVDAGLDDMRRWTPRAAGGSGLTLSISPFGGVSASAPATFPDPLPALAGGSTGMKLPGLDDAHRAGYAATTPVAAVPGLNAAGAVVDLDLADRVAYGYSPKAEFQIWAAPGKGAEIREALHAAGVPVLATRTVGDRVAGYTGQGPGLALMLLVVSAGAAALLALGRAVLALYASARRRTYELAALEAAGARVRPLRIALLLEQAVTLSWAGLAGVAAGVVAARAALPRVPEFAEAPVTPQLDYTLVPQPLILVAVAVLAASLLAAAVTAELLLRGVRFEQLREAPA